MFSRPAGPDPENPYAMPHPVFWQRNASRRSQREIAGVAAGAGLDARAVNILFNAFYDADDPLQGWVSPPGAPAEEAAYARAAGVMFAPQAMDHDALIAWVLDARDRVSPAAVAEAFVASLGTGRLDARSALGSFAHVRHLAAHAFAPADGDTCADCGLRRTANPVDGSARNFRRLKWAGNVEQGALAYVGCDLHLFAGRAPPTATEADFGALGRAFDALRALPASARLADLDRAVAGCFPATRAERRVVLEILGYAGVLAPRRWPCPFDAWVPPAVRREPEPGRPYRREWTFPCGGWTGGDGVREDAVAFWFPRLARAPVRAPAPDGPGPATAVRQRDAAGGPR